MYVCVYFFFSSFFFFLCLEPISSGLANNLLVTCLNVDQIATIAHFSFSPPPTKYSCKKTKTNKQHCLSLFFKCQTCLNFSYLFCKFTYSLLRPVFCLLFFHSLLFHINEIIWTMNKWYQHMKKNTLRIKSFLYVSMFVFLAEFFFWIFVSLVSFRSIIVLRHTQLSSSVLLSHSSWWS